MSEVWQFILLIRDRQAQVGQQGNADPANRLQQPEQHVVVPYQPVVGLLGSVQPSVAPSVDPVCECNSLVYRGNSPPAENWENGVKLRVGPVLTDANLGDIT